MKIKLYKNLPYLLFYTDNLSKDRGGCANGPVVRIRKKYINDVGLEFHEAHHVFYFWKFGVIGRLLYIFSKKWRLNEEVACYREQLKYAPAIYNLGYYRKLYAGYIANDYGLDITEAEAENKLRS